MRSSRGTRFLMLLMERDCDTHMVVSRGGCMGETGDGIASQRKYVPF